MFRKLALVLAAPSLLVAACASEGGQEVRTGAAAVSALRAAPDAVAEAGTAAFELVVEGTAQGQPFTLTAEGVADSDAERMQMEMDMGEAMEAQARATGQDLPPGLTDPWRMVADGATFYLQAPILEMLGVEGWISMTPEDVGTTADAMGLGAGA